MRRVVVGCLLVLVGAGVTGCATILGGGGQEKVRIESDPSGADVVINGEKRGTTPMEVWLSLKRSHTVKLKKGCMTHDPLHLEKRPQIGWLVADAIFLVPTLYLSLGIDYATGAYNTFTRKRLSAKLEDRCGEEGRDGEGAGSGSSHGGAEGAEGEEGEEECLEKEYCDGEDNDCDGVVDEGCG